MALVQVPVLIHRHPLPVHGLGGNLQGVYGPFEIRSEVILRYYTRVQELAPGFGGLQTPFVGEVNVGPAGKAVFQVPLALAVADENQFHIQ